MTQKSANLLVRNGVVYDHHGDTDHPAIADILVAGSAIAAVERDLAGKLESGVYSGPGAGGPPAEIIDATGKLVVPGFFNGHYHSHDVLMKGAYETLPLDIWLLHATPPSYPRRSRDELRARTMLGAWECIRSGITTTQDLVTLAPIDPDDVEVVLDAYDEIGIRVVCALQFADLPGIESVPYWNELIPKQHHALLSGGVTPVANNVDLVDLVEAEYHRHKDRYARVTWGLGPSGPERCSPGHLERVAELSDRYDLPVYTHIYEGKYMALNARLNYPEHGGSLINLLGSIGLLNAKLNLAHSVWLLPSEIERLAETGANVACNPVGNLKTRSGVAPFRQLMDAGVNIALGSDNCSCGDAQNMYQAMKMFACLTGVSDPEPGPPSAPDALWAATMAGARGAGMEETVGAIKPGMKADFSIVDLSDPSFIPLNSIARQLVYTEAGRGVETVVIDGRVVMQDRKMKTFDEAALKREIEDIMVTLRRDMDDVATKVAAIYDDLLSAYRRTWAQDVGINRYVGHGKL